MQRALPLFCFTLIGIFTAYTAQAENLISLSPSDNDQDAIQTALIEVSPGGTVELAEGVYALSDGLSLDVTGVTVIGAGKDKTILSFKGQQAGSEGLLVTSDGVRLEAFAVEDTKGDGIKVKDVDSIVMKGLRAEWTRGPHTENGAYGLYPVGSKNVFIDTCTVIGASDAGIYVGQSENIVIRNSTAERNVAGFEIENSYNADMYNNIASYNTGGFLVFDLPNLPKQGGHNIRVFNNTAFQNNTPNFAPEGNIVASVPQGLGIMIMANRDVEVFNNSIGGNQSVGILINSYPNEFDDANYDPHPRAIRVHDNRFHNNGWEPKGALAERASAITGGPLPDIVWDGLLPIAYGGGVVPPEDWIYVHGNGNATFVNLNMAATAAAKAAGEENPTPQPLSDLRAHAGRLPALRAVRLLKRK